MFFKLLTLLIILLFYSIYLLKMYFQKQKGIKTNQIGTNPNKDIRIIETLMSIATISIIPLQLISLILNLSTLANIFRYSGVVIALIGDLFFLSAVLTMQDSWRAGIPNKKETTFIKKGIYQISRNPAFLGFDLMYLGICLIYCNILTIIFTIFAITMLHFQILEEEKFLLQNFGSEYINYKKQICRYLGRKKQSK